VPSKRKSRAVRAAEPTATPGKIFADLRASLPPTFAEEWRSAIDRLDREDAAPPAAASPPGTDALPAGALSRAIWEVLVELRSEGKLGKLSARASNKIILDRLQTREFPVTDNTRRQIQRVRKAFNATDQCRG
jgi:hypothetical protein